MYKLFNYSCECGKEEERLVDSTELDTQICECGKPLKRLPSMVSMRFGDRYNVPKSVDMKVGTMAEEARKNYDIRKMKNGY